MALQRDSTERYQVVSGQLAVIYLKIVDYPGPTTIVFGCFVIGASMQARNFPEADRYKI